MMLRMVWRWEFNHGIELLVGGSSCSQLRLGFGSCSGVRLLISLGIFIYITIIFVLLVLLVTERNSLTRKFFPQASVIRSVFENFYNHLCFSI